MVQRWRPSRWELSTPLWAIRCLASVKFGQRAPFEAAAFPVE